MEILIHGHMQSPIGVGELMVECPCCKKESKAGMMVISKYYHFYFIPVFPLAKEANIICKSCGLKLYGNSFDLSSISNFDKVKTNYRHPWFTYAGTAALGFLLLSVVIAAVN